MAEVKAFKALVYSKQYRSKIGELISPPYDVIKESEREEMLKTNPHNSVKLCLVDDPNDPERYEKMKISFEEWKKTGVLSPATKNSFYLIEDQYEVEGKQQQRIGFVGLLTVSPFEEKKVFPHEFTLAGPKKDRLALLKTMGAELSQIFFCYDDAELIVENIFDRKKNLPPLFEGTDVMNVKRRLWLVDEDADIQNIQNLMRTKKLLIADGHHRYETALHYAKEEGTEKSKYVQGYFTNSKNPNFSILPIHRLTSLPRELSVESFKAALEKKFNVHNLTKDTELSLTLKKMKEASSDKISFICSIYSTGEHLLLSRKKESDTEAEIFSLQKDVFEKIFDWDVEKISKGLIHFEHTLPHYMESLKKLEDGVGFFLPPTDLEVIHRVVQKDQRMPQKSTFFFPKLASGFVNYELGSS